MKTIFLFASIGIASGLLFTNIYTSLVDARSWGSDVPHSIAAARDYFKAVSPGNFFRIFSPVNQLLGLLVLILFWKASPSIRLSLGAAFVLYIVADAFTFAYFYPRNDIMFKTARLTDVDLLKQTVSQWATMNWLRTAIVFAGLCCSCVSLHKICLLAQK
nr:DUF1772 domain-containing protein [uncultured Mucilaginibacter sp.]